LSYELIGETSVSSLFHLRFVQFSKVTVAYFSNSYILHQSLSEVNSFLFFKNLFQRVTRSTGTFINIPCFYGLCKHIYKSFFS
ncbi:hypothetical protein, partial [Listeria fleischmannii]|uniref:hypothetical protein n=1 Tax=Listeria fleischmannii TaxID=1069827 RepID=UPI001C8A10E0